MSEIAMLGDVSIGMVGMLAGDPGVWWFKVDGIDVKWMAKRNGHVRSKKTARRAVNRAWKAWAKRAGISVEKA